MSYNIVILSRVHSALQLKAQLSLHMADISNLKIQKLLLYIAVYTCLYIKSRLRQKLSIECDRGTKT